MLMQGWICPVCGAGVSPFVEVCPNCKKYYYTYSDINTTPTPLKPIVTCTGTGSINTTNIPNVHCGGLVGTEKCSVAKVNLGDRKGYLQGQNAEELNNLHIATFFLPGVIHKTHIVFPVKEAVN